MRRCPQCGSGEDLATFEKVPATAYVSQVDDDGSVDWEGTTDYGDSEGATGIMCRACGWEYVGEDWLSKLAQGPVKARTPADGPVVEAMIDALGDRGFFAEIDTDPEHIQDWIEDLDFWEGIGGPACDKLERMIRERIGDA